MLTMNMAWNIAQQRQTKIDEEICTTTSYHQYTDWWQKECDDHEHGDFYVDNVDNDDNDANNDDNDANNDNDDDKDGR